MRSPLITGQLSAVEEGSDSFEPVAAQNALFGAGGSLMVGAKHLAEMGTSASLALTFLAGQAAECFLKAILIHAGVPERDLRDRLIRHNLSRLWERASVESTVLPSLQPRWLEQLSRVHDAPFVLRYPLGCHGLVLPEPERMVGGLDHLMVAAEEFLKTRQ